MKISHYILLFLLMHLAFFQPCFASGTPEVLIYDGTKFYLESSETSVDLGVRKTGSAVGLTLRISNQSDHPLLLTNARGSCGLSVPSWPRNSIQPGEEARLQLRYDSSRLGAFNRNITLHTNAFQSRFVLEVKGEVIP